MTCGDDSIRPGIIPPHSVAYSYYGPTRPKSLDLSFLANAGPIHGGCRITAIYRRRSENPTQAMDGTRLVREANLVSRPCTMGQWPPSSANYIGIPETWRGLAASLSSSIAVLSAFVDSLRRSSHRPSRMRRAADARSQDSASYKRFLPGRGVRKLPGWRHLHGRAWRRSWVSACQQPQSESQ
jgi:hypothetical protein